MKSSHQLAPRGQCFGLLFPKSSVLQQRQKTLRFWGCVPLPWNGCSLIQMLPKRNWPTTQRGLSKRPCLSSDRFITLLLDMRFVLVQENEKKKKKKKKKTTPSYLHNYSSSHQEVSHYGVSHICSCCFPVARSTRHKQRVQQTRRLPLPF